MLCYNVPNPAHRPLRPVTCAKPKQPREERYDESEPSTPFIESNTQVEASAKFVSRRSVSSSSGSSSFERSVVLKEKRQAESVSSDSEDGSSDHECSKGSSSDVIAIDMFLKSVKTVHRIRPSARRPSHQIRDTTDSRPRKDAGGKITAGQERRRSSAPSRCRRMPLCLQGLRIHAPGRLRALRSLPKHPSTNTKTDSTGPSASRVESRSLFPGTGTAI